MTARVRVRAGKGGGSRHRHFRAEPAAAKPRIGDRALAANNMAAMDPSTTRQALLLTCMGAAGTALGGLLVVVQPKMNFRRLGVMQVGGTRWR